MFSRMVRAQHVRKVQLGDRHEAERKGYKVHSVICLTEVVLYGPMLDEVLDLMDVIRAREGNNSQRDLMVSMFGFDYCHTLA